MLGEWQITDNHTRNLTRLSNNPVELWFKHLKCHILQGRKAWPSEIAILIYKRILMKYVQFYVLSGEDQQTKTLQNTIARHVEPWKDKNSNRTSKRRQSYYDPSMLSDIITDENSEESSSGDEIEELFNQPGKLNRYCCILARASRIFHLKIDF